MNQENKLFVSIIIPCRNEEKFVSKCLDSIIAQDYPKEKMEILIVDGMSKDKTRVILREYIEKYPFIRVLDNPKKIVPCALNIGLKNARGEIIMRMDAHTTYGKDYMSKCVKYLDEYDADNVGGILKTTPAENTIIAKAITLVLSHRFGAGDSYFRIGSKEPRWVDTVFPGCYKRKVFEKIGLFNEKLIRNQDLEFNLRLKKTGGKILLVPEIMSCYYPSSNLKTFWKHNFRDGFSITYPLKYGIKAFSWRHLVPFVFVLTLIGSGILSFFSLFPLVIFAYSWFISFN